MSAVVMEMTNETKQALGDAMKQILQSKSLSRVTVQELADCAGVSRMTFYYHFQDVYELLQGVFRQDVQQALLGKRSYRTWQEGYGALFCLLRENQTFVLNVYRGAGRDFTETVLRQMTESLFQDIVGELTADKPIPDTDRQFLIDFYEYAFVGILLRWIAEGMQADPDTLIRKQSLLLEGNISDAIDRFSRQV